MVEVWLSWGCGWWFGVGVQQPVRPLGEGTWRRYGDFLPMALIEASDEARALLIGDLAEETKLPRELLTRFDEMWRAKQYPFFSHINDDNLLPYDGLKGVVRSLKVSSTLLCDSVTRVIAAGADAISFETFVRGYAKLHARTLKESLPFAFAVFDLNGDGKLGQEEFSAVIKANLEMQDLDAAALTRVLTTPAAKDADGVTYDAFRYFASLSSETILACCGFLLHCRDFYVPLTPLGTEEEEAAEEAEQRERARREREREHAPQKAGGGANAADGANATEVDVGDGGYFSNPDILAALEQLKTTPEERAERCKKKGNECMGVGKKGAEKAFEHYTEGLKERCRDDGLNATLLGNRAAAQITLKNWGHALADATAALDTDALPAASAVKACRRGASSALQIGKIDQCEDLLRRAEALLGATFVMAPTDEDAAAAAAAAAAVKAGGEKPKTAPPKAPAGGAAASTEAADLIKIGEGVAKLRVEARRKQLEAAAAAAREAELAGAIKKRGLVVRDFHDAELREQCVGERSGARVWYDAELSEIHWPVLLLYPEHAMSDFIQDVSESEAMLPHLVDMFGIQGENSPPWDPQRRYAAPNLHVYAPFLSDIHTDGSTGEREVVSRLRPDAPLLPQLQRLQPKGYGVPGVPVLHIVVKGSEYEQRFFLNRLAP